jgi:hypothetical protein
MDWSEIREEILRSLKEPSTGGTWTPAQLLRRANIVQKRICRDTKCILKFDTSITSIAGTSEYAKPSDSLKILEIRYGNDFLLPIAKASLDMAVLLGNIGDPWQDETGTPREYYEDRTVFGLYPNPDQTGDLISPLYVAQAVDLVADGDIPFNDLFDLSDYHDLIIDGVLWRCLYEDDDDRWKESKKNFIDGMARLYRDMKDKSQLLQTFYLARRRSTRNVYPLPGVQGP